MRSNGSKKSRLGIFCMILGGLLVLGAAVLYGYNCWEDQSAAQATGEVLPILRQEVEKKQKDAFQAAYENWASGYEVRVSKSLLSK